ncbi:MAG: VanZ family protein [Bacillota bacterium]|nr:VanZ family protein [Bacillota bacterium]
MKKNICIFIFVVWLIALLKITVFRSNFSIERLFVNGKINYIPFKVLFEAFKKNGLGYFLYLFLGNIIWFMPLGFLASILTKWSGWKIILAGFVLSLSIEVAQFVFGTGLTEIDDLILNTLGTFAGLEVAKTLVKFRLLKTI